jgi:hypothetical protein
MSKLLQSLAERGIAEKDIETAGFQVSPQYRHEPGRVQPPEIVGYQVSNMVQVKVRELAALGKLLDQVVREGANQLHGISFSVAEPTALQDRAREKAMADARRKAELYVKSAGAKLGRVLQIQEQLPQVPRPHNLEFARAAQAAEQVPIAPGEQEIRVSITVSYAIE